ncbi:hypothetical protein KHQ81_09925 [Mycoplasmatota bacterium]|nr:hypothetical protein KHQ81_09925 [Mycoplasmatota bacterium]
MIFILLVKLTDCLEFQVKLNVKIGLSTSCSVLNWLLLVLFLVVYFMNNQDHNITLVHKQTSIPISKVEVNCFVENPIFHLEIKI